jgi:hypothetical protein
MKLFQRFLTFSFFLCLSLSMTAQNFMEPTAGFSVKKISYLTMKDGSKIEGQFKGGQEALNGGYKWITFKPTDGKKMKIQAAEIQSILLPESKLSKISAATSVIGDATKWGDDVQINEEAVKEGYAYLETITIAKKKKEITAVRQILNPGYSDKIKVLDNKAGMNGATTSLGGIKVAGGKDRSYFIKVGDAKAIKVSAKKYDEQFQELFGSCPEFIAEYGTDIKWSDIEEHVFAFSQMCNE